MAAVNPIIVLGVIVFVVLAQFGIYALRYKRVPPNKAMVVFGKRQRGTRKGYRVITGGAKFIVPFVESYDFLPLDVRTINIDLKNVVTDVEKSHGKINIKCSVQVKISGNPVILNTAAEHLLGKKDAEINEIARRVLEGHIHGLCAVMTLKQLESDRDAVAVRIQTYADNDLKNIGLEIRSFVIHGIKPVIPTHISNILPLDEQMRVTPAMIDDKMLDDIADRVLEKLLKEKKISLQN